METYYIFHIVLQHLNLKFKTRINLTQFSSEYKLIGVNMTNKSERMLSQCFPLSERIIVLTEMNLDGSGSHGSTNAAA